MGLVDSQLQIVMDGLGFPEGPVALLDGRIAFVDMRRQTVFVLDGSSLTAIARIPGAPNGATLGNDGALYLANNGGVAPESSERMWISPQPIDGCLERMTLRGTLTTVATGALPGDRPHRPNDLCFGPDGWLYYTDPHNWEVLQSKTPNESLYEGGRVCRTNLRGTTEVLAELAGFPNGLAFTPDGTELVVAQTIHHRLVTLRVADQRPLDVSVYCELPPTVNPDGICFAVDGSLYVAGSAGDSIAVVGLDRQIAALVDTPEGTCPTNVCLDRGRLWVTLGLAGAIGFIDTTSTALPLAGQPTPA